MKGVIKTIAPTGVASLFIFMMVVPKPPPEKKYPVYHARDEWVRTINAFQIVQNDIRTSTLPANEAFYCDSVLQADINDINSQVYAAMREEADTTHKNKKP